jgi:hypothetical protein
MSLRTKALAYGGNGDANMIPARTASPRQVPSHLSVMQANITLVFKLHSHRAILHSPSAFVLGRHISSSGYPVPVDMVLPSMRPHFHAQHWIVSAPGIIASLLFPRFGNITIQPLNLTFRFP